MIQKKQTQRKLQKRTRSNARAETAQRQKGMGGTGEGKSSEAEQFWSFCPNRACLTSHEEDCLCTLPGF